MNNLTLKKNTILLISLLICLLIIPNVNATDKQTQDSSESDAIPAWKARWELARTLSYARKLDESIKQYQKLLVEKPELTEAKAEMATVMFWQGKQKDALKVMEALPRESLTPEARLSAADIYGAQGKYETAVTLYLEHLAVNPDDHKTRLKLADVLSWAKQYEASLKEYEKLLKAMPDDLQLRRKYALVLSWSGKYEQAAEQLMKTLEEKPGT